MTDEDVDEEESGGVETYVCILGSVDHSVVDELDVSCTGC